MQNSPPPRPVEAATSGGRGLRGRLWVAFVMQTVAIALATLLGVYAAMLVLRDVLIQRALVEEAQHYWKRLDLDANAALPDTYNMQGYLRLPGQAAATIPAYLRDLDPGYHSMHAPGVDELVLVGDRDGRRLWLVFDQHQVDRLALWFGLVPLTLVLGTVYLVSWITYRASRRAVSPVIRLAEVVREQDPKHPDWRAICTVAGAGDADDEVMILADAIRSFAERNADFVERERNFTRDASHELRTPLTVVKVAADVLEEEALTAFGFLARQGDRGANTLAHELHQALDHTLVRVDPGAGQDFAPVARPRPAGDLVGTVAIFLVVGNGIIQSRKHDGREQLARALALLEVEGGAVDGIEHRLFLFFLVL